MKRSRVTWHTKEYTDLCFGIASMCPVPFHLDFDSYGSYRNYIDNSSGAYPGGLLAYLVTKTQRFRYKNRLFKYNLEIIMFGKAMRCYAVVRNYLVNSILKKYLSNSAFAALKKLFGRNDWVDGNEPGARETASKSRAAKPEKGTT